MLVCAPPGNRRGFSLERCPLHNMRRHSASPSALKARSLAWIVGGSRQRGLGASFAWVGWKDSNSQPKMTDLKLQNQVALVTGGSSGIGAAIAQELGRQGTHVAVNYHSDESGANQVADAIRQSGGQALVIQGDVSQEAAVTEMFSKVWQTWGALDIMVANAGIQKDARFSQMSLQEWQKVLDVNLTGQFLCARHAVSVFQHQGNRGVSKANGKILCVSSVHQDIPWANHVNYAASKGGLELLMKSLAQEVASEKIRVNAIAPGAIKTDINREVWEDEAKRDEVLELIPYGRWGEPEDIGKAAAWILSDEADYMVGSTLYIDGGMMLYPSFRHSG